ncbi:hypothetical protein [Parafrankia sp. FMc2]|uniref:hypothetical protein n=1 Tax=Parafrankia sp. FMc2 TaxID=3233196 RepID=UPI0034D5539B
MTTPPADVQLTVHCPTCPDFGPLEVDDLFAGLDAAGTHDDDHHGGAMSAYVHVPDQVGAP